MKQVMEEIEEKKKNQQGFAEIIEIRQQKAYQAATNTTNKKATKNTPLQSRWKEEERVRGKRMIMFSEKQEDE